MARLIRGVKTVTILGSSGILWAAGAGSCLPENYWTTFLGDTIIATAVSTVVGAIAGGLAPQ